MLLFCKTHGNSHLHSSLTCKLASQTLCCHWWPRWSPGVVRSTWHSLSDTKVVWTTFTVILYGQMESYFTNLNFHKFPWNKGSYLLGWGRVRWFFNLTSLYVTFTGRKKIKTGGGKKKNNSPPACPTIRLWTIAPTIMVRVTYMISPVVKAEISPQPTHFKAVRDMLW